MCVYVTHPYVTWIIEMYGVTHSNVTCRIHMREISLSLIALSQLSPTLYDERPTYVTRDLRYIKRDLRTWKETYVIRKETYVI